MHKMLSLIKTMLRNLIDIPLDHFLCVNIPENLVESKINAKKIAIFNYHLKPILEATPPEINLPSTKFPGNKVH